MRRFLVAAATLVAFLTFVPRAMASEGTVKLSNNVGNDARCWAGSVQMPDQSFEILLSCRNIVYPADSNVFNYVVWANPSDGGSAERLGVVGVGKAMFQTDEPFASLFVTIERTNTPRFPSEDLVMSGLVERIEFLGGADEPELAPIPTPVPTPEPAGGVSRIVASGGLAILAGILGIGALVWVITRR